MIRLAASVVLISLPMLVRAAEYNYPEPCTFVAHTTVGTVSGNCATVQKNAPGYHARWSLLLQFDSASTALGTQLRPDQFADMVRTQSAEDGTDIIVLGLWGDLEVVPTYKKYLNQLKAAAPLYETRPNLITISHSRELPYTLEIVFAEPADYLDLVTRTPSAEWWGEYVRSYQRLGTNRPSGFSDAQPAGGDQALKQPVGHPKN
jgi:hypothetical protein